MELFAALSQILLLCLSVFLMIVILLQRGRGGGLAGAFGGLGGQSAFGTKAGDVFTKITVVVAVLWVLVSGSSGYLLRAVGEGTRAKDLGEVEASVSSAEDEDAAAAVRIGDAMPVDENTQTPAGGDAAPESSTPEADTPEPTKGAESSPPDGADDPAATSSDTGSSDTGTDAPQPADESNDTASRSEQPQSGQQ